MQSRNDSLSSLSQQKGQIHINQQPIQQKVNDHYSFEYQKYKADFSSDSEQEEFPQQKKNKNAKYYQHDNEKQQSLSQNQAKYIIDQRMNLHKKLMEEKQKGQKSRANSIESSDADTSSNLHKQKQITQISDQPYHKTSQFMNNNENQGSMLSFITSTINYDFTNNTPNENIPQTLSKSMFSEIIERDKIINEKQRYNQELQDKLQDYEFLLLKSTEELRKKQEEIELYKQNIASYHQSSQDNSNQKTQQIHQQYQNQSQQQHVQQQLSNNIDNKNSQQSFQNSFTKDCQTNHNNTSIKLDSTRKNSLSNQQNDSLVSAISKKQEIINNIENELRKKDETINKAHEIIKKITIEIQQRNQQNQELQIELEQVQKKKQEYKKKYGKFKSEVIESSATIKQLQSDIQTLQNKQQQNEQLYMFKDQQLKKKDLELQQIQSQIKQSQQVQDKNVSMIQENKQLIDEIESLKIKLDKMQVENDKLSNNISLQQQQQDQQIQHLKNEFSKTLQFYKQNGSTSNLKYDESFNNIPSKNTSDFSCTEFDTCQIVLTKPISTVNTRQKTKPSSSQQQNSLTYDKKIFEECEKIQQSIFFDTLNRLQQRTFYINQLMEREDNDLKSDREQKILSFEELDKTIEKLQQLIQIRDQKIIQLDEIIEQMSKKIAIYKHINEGLSKNFKELSSKYQNLQEIQQQNSQNLTDILENLNENQQQEQSQHNEIFDLSLNELNKIQKLEKNQREQKVNESQISLFIKNELEDTLELQQKELDISQLDSHRYLINSLQNQQQDNSDNLRQQIQLKFNELKKNILQTKINSKEIESDRKILLNSYTDLETQIKAFQQEKKEQNQTILEEKKRNEDLEIQIEEIRTKSQSTLNTERSLFENRIKYYEEKNIEMIQQYKQQFIDLKQETNKRHNIIDQLNNYIQTTQLDDQEFQYDKLSARKDNQKSTNNLSTSRINQDNSDTLLLKELNLSNHQNLLEKTIKQTQKNNENQNKQTTQKTSNTENTYSFEDAQLKSSPQFKQLMKDYKEKMKQSFQKRIKELEIVLKFVKEIIKGFDFSNLKYKINCSKKVKEQEIEDSEVKVQLYMSYKESLQKNPNLKSFIDDITNIVNELYEQNYFFLTRENGKIPLTLNPQKVIQISNQDLQVYSQQQQKVNTVSEQLLNKLNQQKADYIEQNQLYNVLVHLTSFYKEKPINLIKQYLLFQETFIFTIILQIENQLIQINKIIIKNNINLNLFLKMIQLKYFFLVLRGYFLKVIVFQQKYFKNE